MSDAMIGAIKAAEYLRVSKSDGSQTVENQRIALQKMAKNQGIELVASFCDEATGSNGDRDGFLRMMEAAERGEFKVLYIYSLDRLTREGISNLVGYLERLRRAGVSVRSHTETWFDTSNDNPVSELLLYIFGWVARQERLRLIERTKDGLERAKKQGKKLGRKPGRKDNPGVVRTSHRYFKSFNPKRSKKAVVA